MKILNDFRLAGWLGALVVGLNSLWTSTLHAAVPAQREQLRVLFLGDDGHHRPADRFKQLQPVLAARGIELIYTDHMEDLTAGKLAGFDCVAIYANTLTISSQQEKALLD